MALRNWIIWGELIVYWQWVWEEHIEDTRDSLLPWLETAECSHPQAWKGKKRDHFSEPRDIAGYVERATWQLLRTPIKGQGQPLVMSQKGDNLRCLISLHSYNFQLVVHTGGMKLEVSEQSVCNGIHPGVPPGHRAVESGTEIASHI